MLETWGGTHEYTDPDVLSEPIVPRLELLFVQLLAGLSHS